MSLYCASLRLKFFFYKLRVCGNPAPSKSIAIMFSTSSAYFMSLCHFGNPPKLVDCYYICYSELWSVVFGISILTVLCSTKQALISWWTPSRNIVCVLISPPISCFPVSFPFLGFPYFLRHNSIKARPLNNSTMATK